MSISLPHSATRISIILGGISCLEVAGGDDYPEVNIEPPQVLYAYNTQHNPSSLDEKEENRHQSSTDHYKILGLRPRVLLVLVCVIAISVAIAVGLAIGIPASKRNHGGSDRVVQLSTFTSILLAFSNTSSQSSVHSASATASSVTGFSGKSPISSDRPVRLSTSNTLLAFSTTSSQSSVQSASATASSATGFSGNILVSSDRAVQLSTSTYASLVFSTTSSQSPTQSASATASSVTVFSDRYLMAFTAWYSDSSDDPSIPMNTMQEINGQSNDINHGFGGKYVWIVINRTDGEQDLSISDFSFHHGSCASMVLFSAVYDLAKGAGGDCRWLLPIYDTLKPKLTDAALWRTPGNTTVPPMGWGLISADLNGGRGGDYLYIVSRYVGNF